MNPGRLYWITGLSGTGKTTLAQQLTEYLRQQHREVVMLDGDDLRAVYGLPGQYQEHERLAMGMRHARLSRLLTSQGLDVVCATISLFHEIQQWNRAQQADYIEILLTCDEATRLHRLQQRPDPAAFRDTPTVGTDIEPQWPQTPDHVIDSGKALNTEPLLAALTAASN